MLTILFSSSCGTHWDPLVSFKPLFFGLDETNISPKAIDALAEAKHDFALARKGRPPHFARLIGDDSTIGAKCYQGRGYRLTIFINGSRNRVGQKIEMESEITGSAPYLYDESFEQSN
ncbi:hypothetical protein [Prosthecobacter dejongeii]|uniref:Uncharacterized protein n=1 Tax=Prosthecobacter dejongeii TaxID=48465 RepID=A0A7W7YJU1_9BACT|nr:hypothetical protein [Prosthecobacter dejongeii]MBB5037555.1 hypothetical protein [Prosthecobacter dejongeii]